MAEDGGSYTLTHSLTHTRTHTRTGILQERSRLLAESHRWQRTEALTQT